MAGAAKRRRVSYATYGNVAYAPGYDGTLARPLPKQPEEVLQPRPKARPRRQERVQARPKVQVREQGQVSIFAIAGFLAVGIFAVLVVLSYVQLTVVGNEAYELREELSDLRAEEDKLLAQYELSYDLEKIEADLTTSGTMVRPQSEQIFVLDLSEPDNVVLYQQDEKVGGLAGLWAGVCDVFDSIVEYFQ